MSESASIVPPNQQIPTAAEIAEALRALPPKSTTHAERMAEIKPVTAGSQSSEFRALLYSKGLTAILLICWVLLVVLGRAEEAAQLFDLVQIAVPAQIGASALYGAGRSYVKGKQGKNGHGPGGA